MYNILNINYFKTIFYQLKLKKIYIYKREHILIKKKSSIINKGKIFLNKDHKGNPSNYSHGYFKIDNNAKLIVNKRLELKPGVRFEIEANAKLEVGDCTINYDTKLYCFNSIKIGNNVIISENCIIRDSDNHQICSKEISKPIIIEDNVWIGMNCLILKGVCIGEGAVVAAGSVVTTDVPKNSLVAGVPAHVIKENICWKR